MNENENLDVKQGGGLEDSSSTETHQEADANAGLSMLDHVKKTLGTAGSDEVKKEEPVEESSTEDQNEEAKSKEEGGEAESDSKIESDGEKKEEEKSEAKEEAKDVEAEGEEKPIPYERFKEVNEKWQKTQTELEEVKPIVEHHNQIVQFCTAKNISQQQFSEGLEVMGLINTNPKEALVKLNKLVEDLQGFVGDRLPADLQAKVDNGKLELVDAKELAQARAQARYGERSLQQYQQMRAQERQTNLHHSMISAVNSWVDSKKNDPDFKPKAKADGPDGKWERVYDKVAALLNQVDVSGKVVNKVETPQQMAALMERAYQAVHSSMAVVKKPATRKPLMHNGSSRSNGTAKIENAKTMREAIELAVKG